MSRIEHLPRGEEHAVIHWFGSTGCRGRCLLIPPFGLAAEALEPVAAALADRGFEVVGLDPRDHVGIGTGDISRFRLSSFAEDCSGALERLSPTCVVAVSLGARATLRALAHWPVTTDAVLLTPVVDVRSTLESVLERDWFEVPPDEVPALVPVLGVDIAAPRFLRDCESNDLVSRGSTEVDLARIQGRLTLIPCSDDPWVEVGVVEELTQSFDPSRVRIRAVDGDRHVFDEDPELAIRLIGTMIDEVDRLHDPDVTRANGTDPRPAPRRIERYRS